MSKQSKQADAWKAWTSELTDDARNALKGSSTPPAPLAQPQRPDDEDRDAYSAFRRSLSPGAQDWLDAGVDTEGASDGVDLAAGRYGIVEAPDGDWAMMRVYKNREDLARRIGQLEGTDTVVWCFYGLPMPVTCGPQRYMVLPGGEEAIMIPLIAGGPCKVVPADLLTALELQEDGFLGRPELANTKMIMDKLEPAKKQSQPDDEDEEDTDEGVD